MCYNAKGTLEMELIKTGDLPLTTLGLEEMRSDFEVTINSFFRRSNAHESNSFILMLLDLEQTATQLATFKAGDKRKTIHQHLYPVD